MPRYRLTVAYDGTDFKGWQKQHPPGEEPLRTAQGVLEEAVRETFREPVGLIGASRTDSGVHAIGQVAAFTSERAIEPPSRMVPALNSRLPADLRVRDVRVVDERFSPISQAVEKQYRYEIAHGGKLGVPGPLFDRRIVTHAPDILDADRMAAGARHLVGTHDFAGFSKRHHGRETTVRTITGCRVSAVGPHRVRIDVCGDGFLWNMVRIIAGTLLEVGAGRIDPEDMPDVIASGDRRRGGRTLPAEGLCLMWIRYEGDPPADELAAATHGGLDQIIGEASAKWVAAHPLSGAAEGEAEGEAGAELDGTREGGLSEDARSEESPAT